MDSYEDAPALPTALIGMTERQRIRTCTGEGRTGTGSNAKGAANTPLPRGKSMIGVEGWRCLSVATMRWVGTKKGAWGASQFWAALPFGPETNAEAKGVFLVRYARYPLGRPPLQWT